MATLETDNRSLRNSNIEISVKDKWMKIERKLFESSLKHIQNKNDTFIAFNPFFSDE